MSGASLEEAAVWESSLLSLGGVGAAAVDDRWRKSSSGRDVKGGKVLGDQRNNQ